MYAWASGSTFPLGATTVTCGAAAPGDAATPSTFVVQVRDTTAPRLTLPADFVVPAQSGAGAIVTFAATAVDVVDGAVPVACTPSAGSAFPIGTTSVASCQATDRAGNVASGGFTVTVDASHVPPQLNLPGGTAGITVSATTAGGATVTNAVTASSAGGGAVAVSCTKPSGAVFALGTTLVTCVATDARGNTATGGFHVSVTFDTTGFAAPLADNNGYFSLLGVVPIQFAIRAPAGAAPITNAVATLTVTKISNVPAGTDFPRVVRRAPDRPRPPIPLRREHRHLQGYNLGTTLLGGVGTYRVTVDLGDGRPRRRADHAAVASKVTYSRA